jgi:hypothetical protein
MHSWIFKETHMTTLFDRAWDILQKNRIPYMALNGLYYGLLLALMVYTAFDAPLQSRTLEANRAAYMTGALSLNGEGALVQQLFGILGRGFLFNVLGGSYGGITLPSFIIPFVGIFLGLYRAILLGIVFSPFNAEISQIILPHIPTMMIEGQATILAMLGAYIQGKAMIWPSSIGHTSRWKAYVEGVRQNGTIYMFIMAILLISAIYGVIEAALLVR